MLLKKHILSHHIVPLSPLKGSELDKLSTWEYSSRTTVAIYKHLMVYKEVGNPQQTTLIAYKILCTLLVKAPLEQQKYPNTYEPRASQ